MRNHILHRKERAAALFIEKGKMVTVEKAGLSDLDDIKDVLRDTWIDTYSDSLSAEMVDMISSQWHSDEMLSSQIRNPSIHFSIAKDLERDILGLATAFQEDDETAYLSRLYVLPIYQGRGIGSKLLKDATRMFPNTTKIRLSVEEMNLKAISFYWNRGFFKTGEKRLNIDDDVIRTIEMEKLL